MENIRLLKTDHTILSYTLIQYDITCMSLLVNNGTTKGVKVTCFKILIFRIIGKMQLPLEKLILIHPQITA